MFINQYSNLLVWVGGQDQIRIVSAAAGQDLKYVLLRLQKAVVKVGFQSINEILFPKSFLFRLRRRCGPARLGGSLAAAPGSLTPRRESTAADWRWCEMLF